MSKSRTGGEITGMSVYLITKRLQARKLLRRRKKSAKVELKSAKDRPGRILNLLAKK